MPHLRETIDQAVGAIQQGQYPQAAELLAVALQLDPQCAEVHYCRGSLAWRQGDHQAALDCFARALRLEPGLVSAYNARGMVLFEQRQLDAAQQAFEQALHLAPHVAQLHNNLGLVLRERRRMAKALACFRRAVEMDPAYAEARNNLGVLLGDLGRHAESIACLERAIADAPDYADAYSNLGAACEESQDFARAEGCYVKAKQIQSDHTNARYNHALLQLRFERWREAWPDFEYRFKTPWCPPREFAVPRWQGEPLQGRTLLLWSEQGLGDTLQFVRFGQLLQQRGGKIVIECQRPLAGVLQDCPAVGRVVARGDALPDFDYHLPLMSVPGMLGMEPDSVPADVPYLHVPAELVADWSRRLGPQRGLRVGVHWRGSPTYRRDYHRSYPFPYLAAMATIPGVELYSLQKHDAAAPYGELCEQFGIWSDPQLDERHGPFLDTAALMMHLDLIITCDTSIAHLAGALARPTWLALRHVACWRWMQQREDTPWYPTMRLYRQASRGDWRSVFQRIYEDVSRLAASTPESAAARDFATGQSEVLTRCVALAMDMQHRQRVAQADRVLTEVLACAPEHPDALCARGLLAHRQGQLAEAGELLQRAVQVAPQVADTHNNLGMVLQDRGRLAEARACYERALQLRPHYPQALNNLGIVARREGKPEEAEHCYRAALEMHPQFAHAHYNLGNLYQSQRRIEAALQCFTAAIEHQPDLAAAHHNRALLWLVQGNFAQGWDEYEWRWHTPLCSRRHEQHPEWTGDEVAGKTVLVYSEQGLGDTLHFVRYVRLLEQRGARVVLECQPPLVPLLARNLTSATVVAQGQPLPSFDVQVPLLSLPRLFHTRLDNIPHADGYLAPDEVLAARWQHRLAQHSGFRIGIHWQGNLAHPQNAERSIPEVRLLGLSDVPGVTLFVLQKGHRLTEQQALAGWVHLGEEFDTAAGPFMDTAAVISQLDLVITCDSAVAHLAGALGVPAWVAIPWCSDWRWLLGRADSPWYSSLRLFRQRAAGDWNAVFHEIRAALAERVPASAAPAPVAREVQQAIQLHRVGRLQEAAQQYESILRRAPDDLDALHMSGLAAHQLGQHEMAIERLRTASARSPQVPAVHNHLGLAYQAAGAWDHAEASFRQALQIAPDFAQALTNLGSLYQKQGRIEEAQKHYLQALDHQPLSVAALYNLGLLCRQTHRFDQAADYFRRCLQQRPGHLEALNYLGECLLHQGAWDEAAEHFERLLAERKDVAVAWNNLGNARKHQGRSDEAERCYRSALECQPDYVEAHYNLGLLCAEKGRGEEAVTAFRAALARRPDYLPAHKNLGHALQLLGYAREAQAAYDEALRTSPSASLQFASATLLPIIYASAEEIDVWRTRFEAELQRLVDSGQRIDPLRDPIATTFFLAYQGRDDRTLHEQVQTILRTDTSAAGQSGRALLGQGKALRVGFISKHLREHTIGRLFWRLIARLKRDDLWTTVLALDAGEDTITCQLAATVDHYRKLPANLLAARQQILDLQLDVLFYLDLGMSPAANALALSRLAPVQCVTWGHPVTSGLDTIDYFISSTLFEPSGAQRQYTEQLVQLETINTYYQRPQLTGDRQTRARWNLPDRAHVYLCPQSLFKLHPHFDGVLARILRADSEGMVVLLDGNYPTWNTLLLERMRASMPDVVDRVRFVSRMPYESFLHLYSLADVILDPLHFGGGNTSYEALSLGVPIVTWPSDLLRGRITAGLYHKMGLGEFAAPSAEAYVQRAVEWGCDRVANARARAAIRESNHVLFDDQRAVDELERFLREAVARAASR